LDQTERCGAAATASLYNVVLQELMARKLSNRGITLPYIDELCRTAFKKVEGKWYLPSEQNKGDSANADQSSNPICFYWDTEFDESH
jgi:hypothetical protein